MNCVEKREILSHKFFFREINYLLSLFFYLAKITWNQRVFTNHFSGGESKLFGSVHFVLWIIKIFVKSKWLNRFDLTKYQISFECTTKCGKHKISSQHFFSWNQLFRYLVGKNVAFTKYLPKKCEVEFPEFYILCTTLTEKFLKREHQLRFLVFVFFRSVPKT